MLNAMIDLDVLTVFDDSIFLSPRAYEIVRLRLADDFHLTGAAYRKKCGRPGELLYMIGLTEQLPRRWFHIQPNTYAIVSSGRFDW